MYKVIKRVEIAGAHFLKLPYQSKCKNLHGHNWIIEVEVSAKQLDFSGMVIDFSIIKEIVDQLDHQNINAVLKGLNPTAEHIARWVRNRITEQLIAEKDKNRCEVTKVIVQESEGNVVCFIP